MTRPSSCTGGPPGLYHRPSDPFIRTLIVTDFMIRFLDSVCVGQFDKKNRSELFVCSFSRVAGSAESVRLSSSLVLILKRITIVQWGKRSSINTLLTMFLSAEERFMFRIGMWLPGPRSWVFTT